MIEKYTKEFLISELQRFYYENGRVPTKLDMQPKFGYPSSGAYVSHFGTFNNGVEAAGFEPYQTNEKRTGNETCCKCGCYKKENQRWITKGLPKGEVMCYGCYKNSRTDYMMGNLDKKSNVGSAFISQRVVAKYLGLKLKDDLNCTEGFKHPFDLYDEKKYYYINVKSSQLHNSLRGNPYWRFNLSQKEMPDTYIMLGFDKDRKNILKAWKSDPLDDLIFDEKTGRSKNILGITNTFRVLRQYQPWEMDTIPLNKILHEMSQKRKDTNGIRCPLDNESFN